MGLKKSWTLNKSGTLTLGDLREFINALAEEHLPDNVGVYVNSYHDQREGTNTTFRVTEP